MPVTFQFLAQTFNSRHGTEGVHYNSDWIHKIKSINPKTMTMHSVITPKSTFILPHPGSSKSQRRSASKISLSLLQTDALLSSLSLLQTDALLSSGMDFLSEMHLRRESTHTQAQKITRKE
jgi:hypothetical protein